MRSLTFCIPIAITSALLPLTASAATKESPFPQTLTLAQAQNIAIQRNWDLLAAKANVDLAVAQKIIAHEFPNPSLSLSTSKFSTNGSQNATPAGNGVWDRNYDTIFAVNQLIEIGGKRHARQASAAAGVKSAEAAFKDAERTLALGVAKSYISVLQASAQVNILNASAKSLRHEANIAGARLNAGDISLSDKTQIDIAAGQLELSAKTAEANAVSAKISLEVLLGEKAPRGNWTAGESLDELATYSHRQKELSMASPRPDLAAAQSALVKSEYDLKLQQAMRIPDPTFLLQYEHNPPDQTNTLGFGVSLPLPLWNQNRGSIDAAKANVLQAKLQVDKVEGQVAADIRSAEVVYDDALSRLHRFEAEIQPQSAKVVSTVSYAYQKGGATLVDLLEAERTDNDVRLSTAQAKADSATAAYTLDAALNCLTFETHSAPHEKGN